MQIIYHASTKWPLSYIISNSNSIQFAPQNYQGGPYLLSQS